MNENSFYVPVGNGTEVSLIKWLQDAEVPVHEIIKMKAGNVAHSIPFDSRLRKSVIAVKHPKLVDTVRVYFKGAAEEIVPQCRNHYGANGQKTSFS